jgi:hypothetical protein
MKFYCNVCDFEFDDVTTLRPVCPLCHNKYFIDKIIRKELLEQIEKEIDKVNK